MIVGHGDDLWKFEHPVRVNFSSNVFSRVDLNGLKQHLAKRFDVISNYPEPEPYSLEAAIAHQLEIPEDAVCVTAGATEAIYLIAHAWRGSRSAIVQPTFSEYGDACRLYGHKTDSVSNFIHFWDTAKYDTVWLCNPNNPTGSVASKQVIEQIVLRNPETVFIQDQSYGFFTSEPLMSASEALAAGNVLQLHSMTKRYAMPGLRLGYIIGNPELLKKVRNVRMPWSVNAFALEAGLWLTAHPDCAPIDKQALLEEAQRLRNELNAIAGIEVEPTRTHFMLCKIRRATAANLKQWLMEHHGLLIRDASNFEGLGPSHFRIAAQMPEEDDLLVAAIKEFVQI